MPAPSPLAAALDVRPQAGDAHPHASAEAALEPAVRALQESVFTGVVRWFAAGALCIVTLLVVQAALGPPPSTSLWIMVLLVALLPAFLPLLRWFGYPRTAHCFLTYLIAVCTYAQCERGLSPGAALAMVNFLCLSALFFGTRGARWAFAAALLSLATSALVSVNPLAAEWERTFWDPHNPLVWARYGAVLFFFGGSVLMAFSKLQAGYMEMRRELATTLDRERSERRERERAEVALEHAQRLEALAQYAGGLAHDFNNSLMVIAGASGLIAEDAEATPQLRALASEIQDSTRQGAVMVRQLLTLGRGAAAPPERVEAAALVAQCRGTLRQLFPRGVQLEFSVDEHAELMVDPAGLQHALLNLALNARDALADRGTFRLRVARRRVSEPPTSVRARPGLFVVVSCEDTGTGMDEQTRSRLFEPFFTTKEAGKGNGLGLASVQRFVHKAGGFIQVESEPGVGSAFHLHFPEREEPAHRDPSLPAPREPNAVDAR